jgi:glycerophosphoryl diester phosphodiesterase
MTVVVAHRGIRNNFPENTLAGIKAAIASGLFGVEFDVELTSDTIPVVVHQETLAPGDNNRLGHADRNPDNRWVNESQASYVTSLDAGSWFSSAFANERVPAFSDVLALDWEKTHPLIELKDPYYWTQRNSDYERRLLESSLALLDSSTFSDPTEVRLLSFNEHLLRAARELGFKGKLVLNVWRNRALQRKEVISIAQSLGACVVDIAEDMALADPQWVIDTKKAGMELYTYEVSPARNEPEFTNWTVASRVPAWKKLLEYGVSGIVSDFPLELTQWLSDPEAYESLLGV